MLSEFDEKMVSVLFCLTDPSDPCNIVISLDQDVDVVILETISVIPVAHKMSLEQFLNMPDQTIKQLGKELQSSLKKGI